MTRPRGRPPMPSAMSRPSEPVDTVSTSIDCMFLPSRMIEPLPKLRSIWESAASRAFDLSMDDPSTRRSAALIVRCSLWPGFDGLTTDAPDGPRCASSVLLSEDERQCTLFVLGSQYVLFEEP